MVYDLLKRRIKYSGDDDDALEDKNKKMDEIWINYCGGLFWHERICHSDWTEMSSSF
uniref:Uncharacterized protein n=1 Tax=Solanum tuberosum TaxID=4113 RepID=M1AQS0_SOLTU